MVRSTRRRPLFWSALGAGVCLVAVLLAVVLLRDSKPDAGRASPGVCDVDPADGQDAITAAIRACPDQTTVRFPRDEVYDQTGRIEVFDRSGLVIDGNGSSFVSSTPNVEAIQPNWLVLRGHQVTFKNMTVQGNFRLPGPRSPAVVGKMGGNQANAGFYLAGGVDILITDVTVRDVFGDFVLAIGAGVIDGAGPATGELPSNITIRRLRGTRSARHAVALTVGHGFTVEDSEFVDNWYGGIDAEIDVPGEPLKDVRVVRNSFSGYHFFAVAVPAPGNDGDVDGVEVRENRILTPADPQTCGVPILVGYYENSPFMANVVVERNRITSHTYGVYFRQVSSGAIRDNDVRLVADPAACGTQGPVHAVNSPNVVTAGNRWVT